MSANSQNSNPPQPASPLSQHAWFWPVLVAAVIRIPLAFYADDQWGDAPIRLDLLQHWMANPGLWWSFAKTFQYGPFPTHLAGAIGLAGFGATAASRIVVCVSGVLSCGLIAVLANKAGGPRAALAAGLALALSPLHIQASTTYASEAIYLAFMLGCIWAAWERRAFVLVACAFAASTTRYDAWLWLPLVAGWWIWKGSREDRRRDVAVAALLGLGPASILIANRLQVGNALAPLNYINYEHHGLVAHSQSIYGVWPWRGAMAGYWPAAMDLVLTPAFGLAIAIGVHQAIKRRSIALLPLATGGLIPVLYFVRTVFLGSLWPMARFILGPTALLAIAMPPLKRWSLAACVAVALAMDVSLTFIGDGKPGIGMVAAAMSPVSRLPDDLAAGGRALRAVPGPVALDWVPTYEDILVAYESGMNRYKLLHPEKGVVPRRIVTIDGGAWDAQLRDSARAFGHPYRKVGGLGRVSWWDLADTVAQLTR